MSLRVFLVYLIFVLSCSVVSDSLHPHGLYSTPGSSVHGILQASILEWVAMSSSRGSFQPRDWTRSLTLEAHSLPSEPQGRPRKIWSLLWNNLSCHSLLWLTASLATQSHELEISESSLTPYFPLSVNLLLICISKYFPFFPSLLPLT